MKQHRNPNKRKPVLAGNGHFAKNRDAILPQKFQHVKHSDSRENNLLDSLMTLELWTGAQDRALWRQTMQAIVAIAGEE